MDKNSLSPATAKLADEIVSNGIDADEILRLRREVFRDGVVDRDEAELIFELNHRTVEKDNAPEWQQTFVQTIANYLMFPTGAPAVPDRAEAARRERWIEERRGIGAFMRNMGPMNSDIGPPVHEYRARRGQPGQSMGGLYLDGGQQSHEGRSGGYSIARKRRSSGECWFTDLEQARLIHINAVRRTICHCFNVVRCARGRCATGRIEP